MPASDNSIAQFFVCIDAIETPTPSQMSSSLFVGLKGLDNKKSTARFALRVERFAVDFITIWEDARQKQNFSGVSKAAEMFINRINTRDIVDKDFPLARAHGNLRNSFSFVRILKSLALLCAGEKNAAFFLDLLAIIEPRPSRFLFFTALSQLLLEQSQYRKAADFAFKAKRLRAYDLCVSKTVFATQKALFEGGMAPDINYPYSDDRQRFCSLPFTTLNIFSRSGVDELAFGLCQCRGWTPMVFGFDKEFSWNSKEAQEFRGSILDGSFRYCDEFKCPKLLRTNLPLIGDVEEPYFRRIIANNLTELPRGPEKLLLAYDRSCNLSCPSCRNEVFIEDNETTQSFNDMMDDVLLPLLGNVKSLQLSQVGEALASAHFRRLLSSISPAKYPDLGITLISNLKLVSADTWCKLGSSADSIKILAVSIDGATPETLEKLRRGLTWQQLVKAMLFAQELRRSSRIDFFTVTFVTQKDNFRELPQMLELCSLYSVDYLSAFKIAAHGSYSDKQFSEINVADSLHPLNKEYRDVVSNVRELHLRMQENRKQILALGRSVPGLVIVP